MICSLGIIILTYPIEYPHVRSLSDNQFTSKGKPEQLKVIKNDILQTLAKDGLRGVYCGVLIGFSAMMLQVFNRMEGRPSDCLFERRISLRRSMALKRFLIFFSSVYLLISLHKKFSSVNLRLKDLEKLIVLYRVSYLGSYDLWKKIQKNNTSLFEMFVVSYLITLSSSIITQLAYTIRKRMMMRSLEKQKYKRSGQYFGCIVKNQGYTALYRGFPIALVTAISNFLLLIAYDKIIRPLDTKKDDSLDHV